MTPASVSMALFTALILLSAVPTSWGEPWLPRASAQSNSTPLEINVAPILRIAADTPAALPIRITPDNSVPHQAMLLIRGLPASVVLSEGRLFDSGVWGVRVSDLPRLKLTAAAMGGVKTQLAISLVTFDGVVLAEAGSSLSITAPKETIAEELTSKSVALLPQPGQQPLLPATPPAKQETAVLTAPRYEDREPSTSARLQPPPKSALTLEELEHVELLMRKGEENLLRGNVNVARLFYSRAADAGWAPAAIALAATYDPQELAKMNVVGGIQADPELARKWYQMAVELGSPEAKDRIQRMGSRN